MQLGWRYNLLVEHKPIDEYESERWKAKWRQEKYHQRPRTPLQRYIRLREFGYSDKVIAETSRSSARQRKELDKSLSRMRRDRLYELKEDMEHAWKGLSSRWKKDSEIGRQE